MLHVIGALCLLSVCCKQYNWLSVYSWHAIIGALLHVLCYLCVVRNDWCQFQLSTLSSDDKERQPQTHIERLLSCERHFVAQMQFGMQRYSRPLSHCIISPGDHSTLFQNVEQVTFHLYHREWRISNCNTQTCNRS